MSKRTAAKPPALGRGLAALIPSGPTPSAEKSKADNSAQTPDVESADSSSSTTQQTSAQTGILTVPIEEVQPMSGQPRSIFNPTDLQELADSITEKGVLQPVIVRRAESGYQLIAGERRWRASQQAGMTTIPVIVKDVDESEAFQLALIENIQRENLNAADIGKALKKLADDFQLTQEEIAERIGKNRATVANYIRILRLPPVLLRKVEDGTLSFGHARCLAGLSQGQLSHIDTHRLVAGRYSVRELEQIVRRIQQQDGKPAAKSHSGESPQVRFVRRKLEQRLGLKVSLKDRNGKGRLSIDYNSLDELDGLLQLLGVADS